LIGSCLNKATIQKPAECSHPSLGCFSHTAKLQNAWVRAARILEVQAVRATVVQAGRHTIVLFAEGNPIYALDNQCPHMGFSLR